MKKTLLFLMVLLGTKMSAQEPSISGTVKISIQKGTIEGDFKLSDIPSIKNYEILLNTGLNVSVIRSDKDSYNFAFEKNYDKNISEESFLYSLQNKEGKFLPDEFSGLSPVTLLPFLFCLRRGYSSQPDKLLDRLLRHGNLHTLYTDQLQFHRNLRLRR